MPEKNKVLYFVYHTLMITKWSSDAVAPTDYYVDARGMAKRI